MSSAMSSEGGGGGAESYLMYAEATTTSLSCTCTETSSFTATRSYRLNSLNVVALKPLGPSVCQQMNICVIVPVVYLSI